MVQKEKKEGKHTYSIKRRPVPWDVAVSDAEICQRREGAGSPAPGESTKMYIRSCSSLLLKYLIVNIQLHCNFVAHASPVALDNPLPWIPVIGYSTRLNQRICGNLRPFAAALLLLYIP